MTVHLNIWDEWAPCRATQRACPRAIHLAMPLTQARQLPREFIEQLYLGTAPSRVSSSGSLEWTDAQGQLHRDNDLPASIRPNGTKEWYQHGKLHRVGAPATINAKGEGKWYLGGKMHVRGNLREVRSSDDVSDLYSLSPAAAKRMVALRRSWHVGREEVDEYETLRYPEGTRVQRQLLVVRRRLGKFIDFSLEEATADGLTQQALERDMVPVRAALAAAVTELGDTRVRGLTARHLQAALRSHLDQPLGALLRREQTLRRSPRYYQALATTIAYMQRIDMADVI